MADAAHLCGDPGHPVRHDDQRLAHVARTRTGSTRRNPCSEYMFLNDTACNLASLNLMKFVREDGEFDVEAFRFAAKVTITAQEILVDNASYPTPKIEENSHRFRPLGLGYANLGALLMSRGLAYDSDEGRNFAAAITAIMHGEAYRQSVGDRPRPRRPVRRVRRSTATRSCASSGSIAMPRTPSRATACPTGCSEATLARSTTRPSSSAGSTATATPRSPCSRPTGTIAFMMDCDTTGIEPDIALIKYKKLVGEGFLKIVNQTVPAALREARLHADAGRGDRRVRQRARDDRGRARPQARAPAGLRLRLQAGQRRAVDPLHGPRPDDGRDPAVHLGRDQQDREHARGRDGRGDRDGLPRGLEAGPQGHRDLPRRLQAHPAAVAPARRRTATSSAEESETIEQLQASSSRRPRSRPPSRIAGACRTSGPRSPTSSTSPATRATSRSACTPTASPARSSSRWPRRARRSRGSWTRSRRLGRLALQYGVPLRDLVNKFAHVRFEPAASPATRRSRSPSRSSTTSSGGWARGSCRTTTRRPLG